MADLRVITLLPAQSVPGIQQPVGLAGAGSQASSILAALPPGSILSGFIINRDAAGNPVLRTPQGDISFSSNFFLKIGSEVVIRVENTGRNTLAHILTVDGQPPEVAEHLSAFASAPEVIVSDELTPTATATASTAQARPTVTITGTVIAPPMNQPPSASPPLPNGTQLTLKVATVTLAPSKVPEELAALAPAEETNAPAPVITASYAAYARAAGASTVTTTAVAPPQTPSLSPTSPTPTAITTPTAAATPAANTIAAQLSPNTTPAVTPSAAAPSAPLPATPLTTTTETVVVTPAATTPSAAPAQTLSAPSAISVETPQQQPIYSTGFSNQIITSPVPTTASTTAPALTATVIGNETTGEAVVQTPVGFIRLQPGTALPNGSKLSFELIHNTLPPAARAAAAQSATPAPLTELARQWTSLTQIIDLLSARSGPTGLPYLMAGIPALPLDTPAPNAPTPPPLSTGLMMFLAALKGGDFTNWLGTGNRHWLEDQGHGDLVRKAEGEFLLMGKQMAEAPPQHWQAMFFPVAVEGVVQQARLFVKRDRKQSNGPAAKKQEDTRFVVEVDLTQLGEMQMDGFVRKREQEVQFDLMIRSLSPLPAAVQQNILQIYTDTGQLTGYKGSLQFQAVREFPVHPMEEIAAHLGKVVA